MILLINAISIKEGGSLLVLKRYIENFLKLRPDMQLHLVLNSSLHPISNFQGQNITVWTYPSVEARQLFIKLWYDFALNNLAKKVRADALFSLTNYLPSRPAVPSLLLVQHAGHFSGIFSDLQSKEFPGLSSRLAWRLKNAWVHRSISTASRVTVQTESLAVAIRNDMNLLEDKITVIPHGLGLCHMGKAKTYPIIGPARIGYITKYGVQKNFGVLFKAVALLKKQGENVRLVLTLDQKEEKNRLLLRSAAGLGIDTIIENHGNLSQENIQSLYDSLASFVFPSLCESFGFPMVEALSRGLPLLVADVPSNREVAGCGAIPFSPYDSAQLAVRIAELIENRAMYEEASQASVQRAASFSWERTAAKTLELIDRLKGKS